MKKEPHGYQFYIQFEFLHFWLHHKRGRLIPNQSIIKHYIFLHGKCLSTYNQAEDFISTHNNLASTANKQEEFRQQNGRTFGLTMAMLPSNEILHIWEVISVVITLNKERWTGDCKIWVI